MRRLSPPASTSSAASMKISLALKAIDFHVHLPTPDWLDVSMRGYIEAAEGYFRSKVVRLTIAELVADDVAIDVIAVLLSGASETAIGLPRVPKDEVVNACREHTNTCSRE